MHRVSSPLKLRKTSHFAWESMKDDDEELEAAATIEIAQDSAGKVGSAIYIAKLD